MNTLHTFGCSLTASSNWTKNLAKDINYQINNCAVPAGDNKTQIRRFHDLVLHNKINESDFILWEITYLNRLGFRLSQDHHFLTRNKDNKNIKHNFHTYLPNILDETCHVDYVAFNEEWYNTNWYIQNINEMLSELLFCFNICKKMVNNNLLVWFADENIFENTKQENNFVNYLNKNKIEYLNHHSESLMGWVKRNSYELADDKLHPTEQIYNLYYKTFILPKIK